MSLHNGIDTVSIASIGIYSKTYGSTGLGAIANLFASLGLLEDAPEEAPPLTGGGWWFNIFQRRRKRRRK